VVTVSIGHNNARILFLKCCLEVSLNVPDCQRVWKSLTLETDIQFWEWWEVAQVRIWWRWWMVLLLSIFFCHEQEHCHGAIQTSF